MRIIALPISKVKISRVKVNKHTDSNTKKAMLVYYHFDINSPSDGKEGLSWRKKYLDRVMKRVTDLWVSLGKAPKGSWKLWTYELGERITDRIDFEESAFRSIDPSSGLVTGSGKPNSHGELPLQQPKIPLIYPPSLYPACLTIGEDSTLNPALAHLQALLSSRGPRHRRGFYLWMLICPLTIPITLIPVIPNLPLFFCVWRSWSHYRAYRASEYLSSLLDRRLIEPNPSIELDKLYASFTPSEGIPQTIQTSISRLKSSEAQSMVGLAATDRKMETAPGTGPSDGVLLGRRAVPPILSMFRLPESVAANIYRAVDQARGRLGGLP